VLLLSADFPIFFLLFFSTFNPQGVILFVRQKECKNHFSTEFLPSFVTLFLWERPLWGRFGGETLAKGM